MKQEDFNEMMRRPEEVFKSAPKELPVCPCCGHHYLGDGVSLCLECESIKETK